jgi:hypothetical protein
VFVIAAPASGAARLARWLANRPIRNARVQVLDALAGPDWRARDDRWPDIDRSLLQEQMLLLRQRQAGRVVRIEQDPRMSLNVSRLADWFPKAQFIYLYRDVRESLGRMLSRWQSAGSPHRSGVTLADGRPWRGPLPPGWSRWTKRPLPEVVAWQWATTTTRALDALEVLAADRWCVASFDRLLTDTDHEYRRLRRFLDLRRPVTAVPTFATPGELSPDPRLWRPHADALTPDVLKLAALPADRAVRLFAEAPQTRIRG